MREHIADAFGLTAVQVNRTCQQLRGERLIESFRRRLVIRDIAALRQVVTCSPFSGR
jgi:hypothetical protein